MEKNKELTLIENIEDLKPADPKTGYLMEFDCMGPGEDTAEEEFNDHNYEGGAENE